MALTSPSSHTNPWRHERSAAPSYSHHLSTTRYAIKTITTPAAMTSIQLNAPNPLLPLASPLARSGS
jgi:hypothetical protein